MRFLAIAASALTILFAIGLATHARTGGLPQHEISNSTPAPMADDSAAGVLLDGVKTQLIRTPRLESSESRSVAECLIAKVSQTRSISSALLTVPLRLALSLTRFSRLQI